jgi:S-adenosylmethionine uptake transporter
LTAIAVGFLGVLLIVRPGTEGFTVYSLYVLGAVASVTIRDIAVRRMTADLPSLTVAVVAAAGVMVTSGVVSAFQPWQAVGTQAVALLAGAALCILLAYVLSVATMRVGDISAVAPFRYTGLLVALTLGFVVFGEWPGALTLAGAALVVGSGVFTLLRERRIAHAGSRPPHAPARVDTPRDSL